MARHLSSDSEGLALLGEAFGYLPARYRSSESSGANDGAASGFEGSLPDRAKASALALAGALDRLNQDLGLKVSLQEYRVPKEHLEKIATECAKGTSSKPGWKELCPSGKELLETVLLPAY